MLHPLLMSLFEAALIGACYALGHVVRERLGAIKSALRGQWHGPRT